ncbi:MAG: chemotaxis protein, partial [Thiovulaceae bacterium]|nr:chemotaxis protein [Sulfurimonadaceae bacterium]
SRVGGIKEVLEENVAIMKLLHEKFPNIKTFEKLLVDNSEVLEGAKFEIDTLQNNGDQIMNIMDIMQYQDIHRQKIERVINVMRALSKYMNTLFSGQVDDSQRVSSAQHIYGDENTEDVMDNDEIEALLNSFGTN